MAGKGDKLRKGSNMRAFWNNYPFEEKHTVSYWASKLGEDISNCEDFDYIAPGMKITEASFMESVERGKKPKPELTDKDIEEMKDCMNTMSFSEFKKFDK